MYTKIISFFPDISETFLWRGCFCRPHSPAFKLAAFRVIYFQANVKQLPATLSTLSTASASLKGGSLEAFISLFFVIKKLSTTRCCIGPLFFSLSLVLIFRIFLFFVTLFSIPRPILLCQTYSVCARIGYELFIMKIERRTSGLWMKKRFYIPDVIYNQRESIAWEVTFFQCDLR